MASDLKVTTHELDGIRYLEYCTGTDAPSAELPCVLVLHWMGSGPETMLPICSAYPGAARFLLPFAPLPLGDAYTWFPLDFYDQPLTEQGTTIRAIADQLAGFLRAVSRQSPYRGRAAVMGLSQGGDLSYALALYHPQTIGLALPLAGRLVPEFRVAEPVTQGERPAIWVFHGADDQVVPVDLAEEAVTWLQQQGFDAHLESYPDVGHDIPREMVVDMYKVLQQALDRG